MRLFGRSYNTPGQHHADVQAPLREHVVVLRYPDGEPTGFAIAETARLDYHEVVPSPVGDLVFHRGGRGYADPQNAKYGHVAVIDLTEPLGQPVPPGGGRGRPAEVLDGAGDVLKATVSSIPLDMHYKRPQDLRGRSNRGARLMHYGDPGADQGDRHDIHYSYLLWSCPNVAGGGMVRALVRDGASMHRCDVDPVTVQSYDESGSPNGTVEMIYVLLGPQERGLYGWVVNWHERHGEGPVSHLAVDSAVARSS